MSQLLDQMRDRIRTLHYSIRTEDSYVLWAKQFIFFHRKRHPLEMGEAEVGEFLTYLAVAGEIRCQFIILARKEEATPDYASSEKKKRHRITRPPVSVL